MTDESEEIIKEGECDWCQKPIEDKEKLFCSENCFRAYFND